MATLRYWNKMAYFARVQMFDCDFPLSILGEPLCPLNPSLEFQILVNVVLSRHTLPIISNFRSLGKLF